MVVSEEILLKIEMFCVSPLIQVLALGVVVVWAFQNWSLVRLVVGVVVDV